MHTCLIPALVISAIQKNYGGIVFPENVEETKESQRMLNTTAECSSTTVSWCSPTNYPDSVITNLIKGGSNVVQLLEKEDQLKTNRVDIGNGDKYDYNENICKVSTDYIFPKAAKNKEGKFKFIVNRPAGSEEYLQKVQITTCKDSGEECAQGKLSGSTISTRCKQEYSDYKLVALSETGEELVIDDFTFPSCCSCVFN
eukprot:TRINITY_DN15742_c0_g1_i1.p1 TRINITY_DN15742_c0_g1~~TRINITY_DN15742_c0_g1_i1.p1  ORF type:complete len:199 (-),score=56.53 TRINITY_DN15742_c0_g1_i1:76-672(-)